jgi:hypothetical protein
MDFQHSDSWTNLLTVYNSRLTIKEAWNKIIDFHENIISRPYWMALRQIEMGCEQAEIKEWIEQLASSSPLPASVVALWIGIFKMDYNEQEIYSIYLVGADSFEKDSIEWACKPSYMPENRYVCPGVLIQVDKIIKTDKEHYEFLDWILPLAYCALTLDEIIRTKLNKSIFLTSKEKLFVATGHDSGDYLEISSIERTQTCI